MQQIRTLGRQVFELGTVQFLWGNPHVGAIFDTLGIEPTRGYFVLRAAPMGRPAPALIGNAFAFFPPVMVAKLVSRSWDEHLPSEVVALAVPHLAEAARSVFGDGEAVRDLAEHLAAVRAAGRYDGRMLSSAWNALRWPDDAAPTLFAAATVLREHRGDGHILALQRFDLSPLEGMLLSTSRRQEDIVAAARSRGWRDDDLEEATARLVRRGAVADGVITDGGAELWEAVERATDRLAAQPWRSSGVDLDEVVALAAQVIDTARW